MSFNFSKNNYQLQLSLQISSFSHYIYLSLQGQSMILHKISDSKTLEFFSADTTTALKLPLYSSQVAAGFPSPADDYIEMNLDLNEHLIQHKAATFYVRVKGRSMSDANMNDGDILVVDRSIEVTNGAIIVCSIDGEFTVKRYYKETDHILLTPANNEYKLIKISGEMQFEIFGVVTYIIHKT